MTSLTMVHLLRVAHACRVAVTCVALLLSLPGCSDTDIGTEEPTTLSDPDSPWITFSEDDWGGLGSLTSSDGIEVWADKVELRDLVELICNDFEIRITVAPASLLQRGISIRVSGATVDEVLTTLADSCKLTIENVGKDHWRLADPNAADPDEETVKPVPY